MTSTSAPFAELLAESANTTQKQKIQLIFAKACADGLKTEAIRLMQMESVKDARAFANEYAKAFSSAFVFISDRFLEGHSAYEEMPASSPSSTPEADPQSSPEDQHQELLSLMRLQAETQERISQLLER
ncbi:hypothetical protein JC795_28930 [Pseudomonas veronii]|uniref:hypothetical protein n=1 Tax=Pseudomonas veronii TaxID=76761 RepID=UPI0018E81D64|nr:hypothetical protein [Pseudomonas veronii]EKT4497425.1 hypothetical protein [Pseudomonas putida]EKT8868688.1 hypothetical protein [Pseudomonas putida]MBJ2182211.1 hypothetical protein [Pseudomonas veronii]